MAWVKDLLLRLNGDGGHGSFFGSGNHDLALYEGNMKMMAHTVLTD